MNGAFKHLLLVLCLGGLVWCTAATAALADGYNYAGVWGSKGSGNGQFDGIGAIAVDASGNIYVSDSGAKRIEKFNSSGGYLLQWSTGATVDGLAVDTSGNVYATDYWNAYILKYSPTGTSLAQFSTTISGDTLGSNPNAIAVDGNGTIYITDSGDYLVKRFSAAGTYLGTLGDTGSGAGQLRFPVGIAVDPGNNVYVVDCTNYNIQKFSSSGTYLTGNLIMAPGDANLMEPIHVAVDHGGDAFVSDTYSGTLTHDESVKKFNPGFVFQTRIGIYSGSGVPAGTFAGLAGLAVDGSGNVYLADTSYDRILKFTSSTPTPPPTPTPGTPSVTLKATPKSVKVGHSVKLSGTVANPGSAPSVSICRKVAGKLTVLKRVALKGGTFSWSHKMTKAGKWVLEATCSVGSVRYGSKTVTVTVHG